MQIHDLHFEPFIDRQAISQCIADLGKQIASDYEKKQVCFICVLNGAFVFAADLVRAIPLESSLQFVRVRSYEGTESEGTITEILGLGESLAGKHVVIVEDIVDSGLTIEYMHAMVEKQMPASLKVASLLLKKDVYRKKLKIDYIGFEIPSVFVVGYGLDYDGLGRNIPEIYKLKK